MRVLIVESDPCLGWLWKRHIENLGAVVDLRTGQEDAVDLIEAKVFDVILLNLVLADGSATAIADYASYRSPATKVVFVTNTTFFSDGSIFQHFSNACAFLPTMTPPEDLAAVIEHYATAS